MRQREAGICRCGREITGVQRGGEECRDCWEQRYAFEGWMLLVDRELERRVGNGSSDLPDFLWRDHFDAGSTAEEAVSLFLQEEE